jgi:hypothetical protein
MTAGTTQTITSICLIIGTFFLAIEAVGRDRALKIESAMKRFATSTERVFASVLVFLATPWKKIEANEKPDQPDAEETDVKKHDLLNMPRWVGSAFLTMAFLSLLIFHFAVTQFGEKPVTIVVISSWFGMIVTSLVVSFCIKTFQETLKGQSSLINKIKLLVLSATIAATGLLFGVATIITFLSCFPAAFIFIIYVGIYLVATILRRIIDFRLKYNLGNVFILFGLLLSIIGIFLQHLISVGVFPTVQ